MCAICAVGFPACTLSSCGSPLAEAVKNLIIITSPVTGGLGVYAASKLPKVFRKEKKQKPPIVITSLNY